MIDKEKKPEMKKLHVGAYEKIDRFTEYLSTSGKRDLGVIATWIVLSIIGLGGLSYCNSCFSKSRERAQQRFKAIDPTLEYVDIMGVEARVLRDLNKPAVQYVDLPQFRSLDFIVEDVEGKKFLRTDFTYNNFDERNWHTLRDKTAYVGLVDSEDIYAKEVPLSEK